MNRKISNVAEFLREARLKAGLSQAELSDKLGYTSPQIVSNWERGLCWAPLDKLYDLSQLLKLNKAKLIELLMAEQEDLIRSKVMGKSRSSGKRA